MCLMDLEFVTIADRPDLFRYVTDFPDDTVAEFLYQDPVSNALFVGLIERHPEFTVMAVDPGVPAPVGMTCTMPFTGSPDGELPPGGYDAVLLSAAADAVAGRRGDRVAALFAVVRPQLRGTGLSPRLMTVACDNGARLGYSELVVPARPTRKHEHPRMPMADYMAWTREDGLPVDPWLRVHVRAGGEIVGLAPSSMTITGTLDEWRRWTGLPFAESGPVEVPGGFVPVQCDTVAGVASYVEPNVWVRHRLSPR
ncbi:hypothetical protein Voc01_071510 [Virgisporangium ochraceum]|uniref:Uncharacterized protein n=2 Tax=Virgisporangium ochraceum TaxID=65505 RepID=A0A8J4EEX8_9ACTN|nr:hypothetical protein Voc01_071510 [Virgisporangium ochraceum]